MNFGLTGIGIGGLFYIGSALVILIIEGYKLLSRRYKKDRTKLVIDLVFILSGFIIATILTDKGADIIFTYITSNIDGLITITNGIPKSGLLDGRAIIVSLSILAIVLIVTNSLWFIVKKRG